MTHRRRLKGRESRPTRSAESQPARAPEDPMYGVAMLKIAMELKKSSTRGIDEVLPEILKKMKIREADFRAYLAQKSDLLRRRTKG